MIQAIASAFLIGGGAAMATGNDEAERAARAAWLKGHATALRSIDPTQEDWSDWAVVARAIGDARVVLLGEGSHGDGAAFLSKGRLVRFLHQQAGFDVLVWESPFYACFVAGTPKPESPLALEESVLPIWGGSRQCVPTFDYVRATWKTKRPIALVGLSQYVLPDDPLFADLSRFFQRVDPAWPTAAQRAVLDDLRTHIRTAADRPRPSQAIKPPQQNQLAELMKLLDDDPGGRIAAVHGAKDKALMRMALQNLVAFAQSLYRPLSRGGADDTLWSAQEGANLLYWANEHFPGRKLIVWAHNGHIIRNTSKVEELGAKFKINEYISAGDHVRRAMGEQAYSIMFLTHGGNTGMWWDEPRDVRPAGDNSIESLFHQAGLGDSFLDLRRLPADHWLSRPQVASPIAHQPMRAAWPDCFDGIVYIDEMTPSEKR